LYIIQVNDIIKSIGGENNNSNRTIYVIENKGIIENFDLIDIYKLERIVMSLSRKKGIDEGITSDILKACFCVIGEEFTRLINDLLNKGICPEGWRTSTIIPIPKIEKPKKASEYRPIYHIIINIYNKYIINI